ncbi:hypothetical protein OQ496_03490 [Acetobacter suratthaniensis]|uniref:HRDC domain-containing protein n=1 Tax=Acetobacter suratthaniensis TaxID=1502841 RepID=A0ABS3LH10_9PROT|nr:hypothetical protein [Acetobacter suratthaniensis]MBO1326873.1 hypothetical protein [Acetobacter suratthaniensis]MCX2565520.1 hypothetical protein [Acetobacter suratthaniensis]
MSFLHAVKSVVRRKRVVVPGTPLNTSALLTVLNEVLGPVPRPDRPSKLDRRARAAGMLETLLRWRESQQNAYATPKEIRALVTRTELMAFSEHTGLSGLDLQKAVSELLPHCIRIRAHNNPFFLLHND